MLLRPLSRLLGNLVVYCFLQISLKKLLTEAIEPQETSPYYEQPQILFPAKRKVYTKFNHAYEIICAYAYVQ